MNKFFALTFSATLAFGCAADGGEDGDSEALIPAEESASMAYSFQGCTGTTYALQGSGSSIRARGYINCTASSGAHTICAWVRGVSGSGTYVFGTEGKFTVNGNGSGTAYSSWVTPGGMIAYYSCSQMFVGTSCSGTTHTSAYCL